MAKILAMAMASLPTVLPGSGGLQPPHSVVAGAIPCAVPPGLPAPTAPMPVSKPPTAVGTPLEPPACPAPLDKYGVTAPSEAFGPTPFQSSPGTSRLTRTTSISPRVSPYEVKKPEEAGPANVEEKLRARRAAFPFTHGEDVSGVPATTGKSSTLVEDDDSELDQAAAPADPGGGTKAINGLSDIE